MPEQINCEPLKQLIRTVPDFPRPGILFYDITTLLKDKTGFAQLIDAFAQYYIGKEIDLVLGIEARGFIFGPALAYRLNAGFVPVRKPKKLPAATGRSTTTSNTAPTRSRFTWTPSSPASASSSSTTCSPPAAPWRPPSSSSSASAASRLPRLRHRARLPQRPRQVPQVRRLQPPPLRRVADAPLATFSFILADDHAPPFLSHCPHGPRCCCRIVHSTRKRGKSARPLGRRNESLDAFALQP